MSDSTYQTIGSFYAGRRDRAPVYYLLTTVTHTEGEPVSWSRLCAGDRARNERRRAAVMMLSRGYSMASVVRACGFCRTTVTRWRNLTRSYQYEEVRRNRKEDQEMEALRGITITVVREVGATDPDARGTHGR